MNVQHVEIVFQVVAFLFAISVHESAHALIAWRCGDPTARMLGRVTLNPIKHIDPWGTVIIPAICIATGFPVIGWAKPTPVNSRNFKNVVRSDILTSMAGPISNLLVATGATLILLLISLTLPNGRVLVHGIASGMVVGASSPLVPICLLLYWFMLIKVLLAVFNVIPIPPLDGSHVVRHFIPPSMLRAYEIAGTVGFLLLFLVGGRVLMIMMAPFVNFFRSLLMGV
jgi:Zn-dependent protease